MSAGMLCRVDWQIATDLSEERRVMQAALEFMTLKMEAPGKRQ